MALPEYSYPFRIELFDSRDDNIIHILSHLSTFYKYTNFITTRYSEILTGRLPGKIDHPPTCDILTSTGLSTGVAETRCMTCVF